MSVLFKATYRFSAIAIKILEAVVEIDTCILKFTWKYKGPRIANTTLKKNKLERLKTPNCKTYLDIVIKTLCYHHMVRYFLKMEKNRKARKKSMVN